MLATPLPVSVALPDTVTASFLAIRRPDRGWGVSTRFETTGFVPSGGGGTEMVTIATFESGLMSAVFVPSVQTPVSIR